MHLCTNRVVIAPQTNFLSAVDQAPAECAGSLVTNDDQVALGTPDVVFQMMMFGKLGMFEPGLNRWAP